MVLLDFSEYYHASACYFDKFCYIIERMSRSRLDKITVERWVRLVERLVYDRITFGTADVLAGTRAH